MQARNRNSDFFAFPAKTGVAQRRLFRTVNSAFSRALKAFRIKIIRAKILIQLNRASVKQNSHHILKHVQIKLLARLVNKAFQILKILG